MKYKIEIEYSNTPGDWHPFYETFDSKIEAIRRLIVVQAQFPKNVFSIKTEPEPKVPHKGYKMLKGEFDGYRIFCNECGEELEVAFYAYDKTIYVDLCPCHKEVKNANKT